MDLNYDEVYGFDHDFEVMEKDDHFLFIDYENVNWFRTNNTGREIISLCNGQLSLNEILSTIANKYHFSLNVLKNNFGPFIAEAIQKGVLIKSGEQKQKLEPDPSEYPMDIWIHVSNICNLNCPFCYSRVDGEEKYELNQEALLHFLEQVPEEKRLQAVISGGEPFLYKGLSELTRALKDLNFKDILVITNGTVGGELYPQVLPNIHSLQISVDGASPEHHDRTRGKGSFDKMRGKFKIASELGLNKLVISFTPTKYNITDLPNIPEFALDNGVDVVHVTRLMPVGQGEITKEEITPDREIYSKYMGKFLNKFNKLNQLIHIKRETEQLFYDEKDKSKYLQLSFGSDQSKKVIFRNKKYNCGLGSGLLSINYDGNISPCPCFRDPKNLAGNIQESKYIDVYNNCFKMAEECSVHHLPGCQNCKWKYFCGGGCRAFGLSNEGNILGKDPLCEYYQDSMLEIMWVFESHSIS